MWKLAFEGSCWACWEGFQKEVERIERKKLRMKITIIFQTIRHFNEWIHKYKWSTYVHFLEYIEWCIFLQNTCFEVKMLFILLLIFSLRINENEFEYWFAVLPNLSLFSSPYHFSNSYFLIFNCKCDIYA